MDDEVVSVRVIPRAGRRTRSVAERAGRLVVRTTAAPTDGKANEAVRQLLASHFGVSTRQVELVSGATISRQDGADPPVSLRHSCAARSRHDGHRRE